MNGHYCSTDAECGDNGCCNQICFSNECKKRKYGYKQTLKKMYLNAPANFPFVREFQFVDKSATNTLSTKIKRGYGEGNIRFIRDCHAVLSNRPSAYAKYLKEYTKYYDEIINPILRSGRKYGRALESFMRGMDNVLHEVKLQDTIYVYRGIKNVNIDLEKKRYIWSAYTSTSLFPHVLERFGNISENGRMDCCNFIIEIPKNMTGAFYMEFVTRFPTENEVLLARNAIIEVVDKYEFRSELDDQTQVYGNIYYCRLLGFAKIAQLRISPFFDEQFVKYMDSVYKEVGNKQLVNLRDYTVPKLDLSTDTMLQTLLEYSKIAYIYNETVLYDGVSFRVIDKTWRKPKYVGGIDYGMMGLFIGSSLGITYTDMTRKEIKTVWQQYPVLHKSIYGQTILNMRGTRPGFRYHLNPTDPTIGCVMAKILLDKLQLDKIYDPENIVEKYIDYNVDNPDLLEKDTIERIEALEQNFDEYFDDNNNTDASVFQRITGLLFFTYRMDLDDAYNIACVECRLTHSDPVVRDACGVLLLAMIWTLTRKIELKPEFLIHFAKTPEVVDRIKKANKPVIDGKTLLDVFQTILWAYYLFDKIPDFTIKLKKNDEDTQKKIANKVLKFARILEYAISCGGNTEVIAGVVGQLVWGRILPNDKDSYQYFTNTLDDVYPHVFVDTPTSLDRGNYIKTMQIVDEYL